MIYFTNSLFCWLLLLAFMWRINRSLQENDESYKNQCRTKLADRCFKDFDTSKGICESLEGSLLCAAGIIDGDCTKTNGLDNFHSWLKGLHAVYSYMCFAESSNGGTHGSTLPDLNDEVCWSKGKFFKCVGEMANIHHVVDLLNTSFGYNDCIRTVISMTTCNGISSNEIPIRCDNRYKKFVNDLLYQFFSQHQCNNVALEKSGSGFLMTPNYLLMSIMPIIVWNYIQYNIRI